MINCCSAGEYTIENKTVNKKVSYFPGTYWLIVTAIYVGYSLYTDSWHRSWIIWPVAGMLFAAIYGILREVAKRK